MYRACTVKSMSRDTMCRRHHGVPAGAQKAGNWPDASWHALISTLNIGDLQHSPPCDNARYEVVANFVAVRKLPSLEAPVFYEIATPPWHVHLQTITCIRFQAPFVRRLKKGAKVEMFEWDKTRRTSGAQGCSFAQRENVLLSIA